MQETNMKVLTEDQVAWGDIVLLLVYYFLGFLLILSVVLF